VVNPRNGNKVIRASVFVKPSPRGVGLFAFVLGLVSLLKSLRNVRPGRRAEPGCVEPRETVDNRRRQLNPVGPMGRTAAFQVLRRVLVGVHANEPPSDEDWDAWTAFTSREVSRFGAILIFTADAAPNGLQRAKMAKVREVAAIPTAIITNSAQARGIATAFKWIGKNVCALSPDQMEDPFRYLSVPVNRQSLLLRDIPLLRARLPKHS
jgi:hypothetical protein